MDSALIVSIVAVSFTALNFAMTFILTPHLEKKREVRQVRRDTISEALAEVLSSPVADARSLVGQATRSGPGKTRPMRDVPHSSRDRVANTNMYVIEYRSTAIGAAFTLMWHLELVHLRVSGVAKERDMVPHDIHALYRHVDLITRELVNFLIAWSESIEADDTVGEVNRALGNLPVLTDESAGKTALPTAIRLPTGKMARLRLRASK